MTKNNVLPRTPTTPKRKSNGKNTLILVSALLAFLLSSAALITAQINFQHAKVDKTQQMQAMHAQQRMFVQQVQQRLETTEQVLNQLLEQQQNISASQARTSAEALVRMAQWQISFMPNGGNALHLLSMALAELAPFNTPSIMALRKAIRADMVTVKAIPQVDIAAQLMKVDEVLQYLQALLIDAPKPAIAVASATTETATGWEKLKQNMAKLGDLIRVRHLDDQADALFIPEQAALAKQLAVAKLLQAQWAVLNAYPQLFKQSIQGVEAIISGLSITRQDQQFLTHALQELLNQPVRQVVNVHLTALSQNAAPADKE